MAMLDTLLKRLHRVFDKSDPILLAEIGAEAQELAEQSGRIYDIEKQMYLHSSESFWLDYWCDYHFGIARQTGETDADYLSRLIVVIMRPTQNGLSIEEMLLYRFPTLRFSISTAPPDNIDGKDHYGNFYLDITYPAFSTAGDIAGSTWQSIDYTVMGIKAAGTRHKTRLWAEMSADFIFYGAAQCSGEAVTIYPP